MAPQNKINKRNRRRLGARSYKNYSEEMLQLAVDLVKNKKSTSYDAEKHFGIPRRTIEKRVKNLHSNKPGPRFRLTPEEETKFIKVLIAAGDFGCPLSMMDLKLTVWDYLKKNNKTCIFNDKLPGDWWVRNFIYRHKDTLTLRSTQNITRARAEKTLEEFEYYFKNLEVSVQNLSPSHIVNYDETNVSDDPGSTKSIFRRGIKYPERIINHSKGCISLMFAATAAGDLLPPYVFYKAEYLWSEWCKNGPEGAYYNRSKSGWFDSIVFLDWFNNIIIPWASKLEGEKLVIGDNLSSHLNPEVVELCETYQIRFSFLPSRSTQLTQPLDVAFFAPLKRAWRNILLKYKTENPKQLSINKSHFPMLLKQLMEFANLKKQNIISGFKATGIHPFNPYEVYKRLPEFEHEIKYDVDETLLNYLKENKHPNPIAIKKNTKLNVAPGKAVTSSDIVTLCTKKKTMIKKNITNKNTTANQISEDITVEQQDEQITSVISSIKNVRTATNTLTKISRSKKPLVKRKYWDDSSDSNSSYNMSVCDTSEYDPKDDEDANIDKEEEINETVVDSTQSEKLSDLEFRHKIVLKDDTIAPSNLTNEGISENIMSKIQVPKRQQMKEIKETSKVKGTGKVKNKGNKKEKRNGKKVKVTILSEIKNTPENHAYFDLTKYGPLKLKHINKDVKVKCTKSLQDNDDPEPVAGCSRDPEPIAGCSHEPEKRNSISYNINDHILARYIDKKRVQYYVGKIIAKDLGNKYKISFYKRYGKNDNIKFSQPKIEDIDVIDEKMIVKSVQLMTINEEETEFVFYEDDDLVYFN